MSLFRRHERQINLLKKHTTDLVFTAAELFLFNILKLNEVM